MTPGGFESLVAVLGTLPLLIAHRRAQVVEGKLTDLRIIGDG
jgi:hypothetical protein